MLSDQPSSVSIDFLLLIQAERSIVYVDAELAKWSSYQINVKSAKVIFNATTIFFNYLYIKKPLWCLLCQANTLTSS